MRSLYLNMNFSYFYLPMYKIIILLFITGTIVCKAQSSSKGIKVVYDYSNDYVNTKEVLFANSKNAVYTINPKNNSWDCQTLGSINEPTKNDLVFQTPRQVEIYLSSENDLVTMNTITNDAKRHVVNDSTISFEWKLYPKDEKLISGYKCYKAGLTWRGRNYTAYYTPEIPLPFGPFKFKGLPGLIISLETSSHGQNHSWIVSSIKSPYTIESNIAITDKVFKGKRINLYQLIQISDNLVKKDIQIKRARLDKTQLLTRVVRERNSVEKVYEWEKGGNGRKEYFKETEVKY
jgi:GLPGLI family protein